MDRITGPGVFDIGGRRSFRGRDALAGLKGTEVRASWLNAFQEELMGVIEASGMSGSSVDTTQLLQAMRRQKPNFAVAAGTPNALTATLTPAPQSYGVLVGMPLRLRIAATNTAEPTLNISGLGPIPMVTPKGRPLKAGDLPAGALISMVCTGTSMMLVSPAYSEFRQRLQADLILYASPAGNDANDGLTPATAVREINKAIDLAGYAFDSAGRLVTVIAADGRYGPINCDQTGATRITVIGNSASLGNVVVDGGAGPPLSIIRNSVLTMIGVRYVGAGTISVSSSSTFSFSNVDFGNGSAVSSHIYVTYGGTAIAVGPYVVSSSAVQHVTAGTGGGFIATGVAITLLGTPHFSGQFVQAGFGFAGFNGVTFYGSATGQRYAVYSNGVIFVAGGGANFLPGNVAGSADGGGRYD